LKRITQFVILRCKLHELFFFSVVEFTFRAAHDAVSDEEGFPEASVKSCVLGVSQPI